jgi:hypothetical protein
MCGLLVNLKFLKKGGVGSSAPGDGPRVRVKPWYHQVPILGS